MAKASPTVSDFNADSEGNATWGLGVNLIYFFTFAIAVVYKLFTSLFAIGAEPDIAFFAYVKLRIGSLNDAFPFGRIVSFFSYIFS